jgi:hypothetical protein
VLDVRIREHSDERNVAARPATDTSTAETVERPRASTRSGILPPRGESRKDTPPPPPPAAVDSPDTETEPAVPVGPRPRASLLATLSLIFGVAGALFVATGALAGYGIALGVVALILAIAGVSATGRRHVAGKTDALIGLVLGLAAVVVGILVLTGSLSWLGTGTDTVARVREWLDAQFVNRF